MASNYKDSGYTAGGTTAPSADIYDVMNKPGVFMINGNYNSNCIIYPVYCSLNYMDRANIPFNTDEAYIVYPGWGIQLYDAGKYTGVFSNVYHNTSNKVKIYSTSNSWDASTGSTRIQTAPDSSNPNANWQAWTDSIKVFFRGTRVDIDGLSNS